MFEMLLPMALPNTMFGAFFSEPMTLTNNSGMVVPIETIVRPITRLEIFRRCASEEEPFTRRSAPFMRKMIPTTRSKYSSISG